MHGDTRSVTKLRPPSLTCVALGRFTAAVPEAVSGAAAEAAVSSYAGLAARGTRLAAAPGRVEEALRTRVQTLILKEVPGLPDII